MFLLIDVKRKAPTPGCISVTNLRAVSVHLCWVWTNQAGLDKGPTLWEPGSGVVRIFSIQQR